MKSDKDKKIKDDEILKIMDEAMKESHNHPGCDNDDNGDNNDKDPKIDYLAGVDNQYHCPNCNHVLNSRKETCPKCGYHGYVPMTPKETRFIKIILFAILLIAFIVFMILKS